VANPPTLQDVICIDSRLLAQAPELAALAHLEVALAICVRALLAEHPTLAFERAEREPASLRRARRLLACMCPLQRAMCRYRAATLAVLTDVRKDDDDDLPF
jgi:hypothetical protein